MSQAGASIFSAPLNPIRKRRIFKKASSSSVLFEG
jgi:hypothetical protein